MLQLSVKYDRSMLEELQQVRANVEKKQKDLEEQQSKLSGLQETLTSIASADYVSQAHEKGLQVWGLIDNFTQEVSTTETLSSTAARQNIISQLIQAAKRCGNGWH